MSDVLVPQHMMADVLRFGKNEMDEVTQREVLQSGLIGHIWAADIHVSPRPQATLPGGRARWFRYLFGPRGVEKTRGFADSERNWHGDGSRWEEI